MPGYKMKEKKKLIYLYQELKKDDEPDAMAFLEFAEDSIDDNWKTIQRINGSRWRNGE